jgi:hypothetical protein
MNFKNVNYLFSFRGPSRIQTHSCKNILDLSQNNTYCVHKRQRICRTEIGLFILFLIHYYKCAGIFFNEAPTSKRRTKNKQEINTITWQELHNLVVTAKFQ